MPIGTLVAMNIIEWQGIEDKPVEEGELNAFPRTKITHRSPFLPEWDVCISRGTGFCSFAVCYVIIKCVGKDIFDLIFFAKSYMCKSTVH